MQLEPAAERLDPVAEAAHARAAALVGAAHAVVGDLDQDAAVRRGARRTRTREARACLEAFVSASATM